MSYYCYVATGRDVKAYIEQDLAIGFIAKIHVLKANRGVVGIEVCCARFIFYLLMLRQQTEHFFHISQRVLDFPVNESEEMQGHIKLQHESIDQHEVAQRHGAFDHTVSREPQ